MSLFCMCLTFIIPPVTHIISHSHSLTTQHDSCFVWRDSLVLGNCTIVLTRLENAGLFVYLWLYWCSCLSLCPSFSSQLKHFDGLTRNFVKEWSLPRVVRFRLWWSMTQTSNEIPAMLTTFLFFISFHALANVKMINLGGFHLMNSIPV